jgi:hypothetical protein
MDDGAELLDKRRANCERGKLLARIACPTESDGRIAASDA